MPSTLDEGTSRMTPSSSTAHRLRTTMILTALCAAVAACGGGGGGGGAGGSDPVGTPSPSPVPSPGPSPAPAPTPIPGPNLPPTASFTGGGIALPPNAAVSFTATSTDPEGLTVGQMTHTWVLVARPAGSSAALTSSTGTTVSVTPDVVGTYEVRLVSSDGPNASAPQQRSFTVAAVNAAPTAVIAPIPSGIIAGRTVTLTAVSTDPEGVTPAQMVHTWSLVGEPTGNSGGLSSTTGTSVTLRPTVGGAYAVRLVSSDGVNNSAPVSAPFTILPNTPPVAQMSAVPGGTLLTGVPLSFNSTGSADPDGDAITTTWTLTGPSGTLSSPSAATVGFTPTAPGSYTLQLVVSDGLANTSTSRNFAVAGNGIPTSVITSPTGAQLAIGGTKTFSASTSTDPEGQTLTHQWTLVSAPAGSTAALSAGTGTSVTLSPTVPGNYTVRLVSNDGVNDSLGTTQVVTLNSPPSVSFTVSGSNGTPIQAGDVVTAASTSVDPEGQSLVLSWALTRPAGSTAVLSSTTAVNPTFIADVAGVYSLSLTANDNVNPPVVNATPTSITVASQPGAVACSAQGGVPATAGRFAAPPPGPAEGMVSVGTTGANGGNTVCFQRSVFESIRGTDLMTSGRGSFHYFEVRRAGPVAVGVVADNAPLAVRDATNGLLPDLVSSVIVSDNRVSMGTVSQSFQLEGVGALAHFGMAVDYRDTNPIVYVVGQPSSRLDNSAACQAAFNASPRGVCVVARFRLDTTAGLRLYAYGRTEGTNQARLTINGMESGPANQAREPSLSESAVRAAIRASWINGDAPLPPASLDTRPPALDTGLNPQWPVSTGGAAAVAALAQPVVNRVGFGTAVLRRNATAGFRTSFNATATIDGTPSTTFVWAANGNIVANQTAGTLDLVASGLNALPVGRHRIEARVTNNGVVGFTAFQLVILDPTQTLANPDEDFDGDGRTYDQEAAASPATDPANADTNGDAIADGVGPAPPGTTAVRLTRELGVTGQGIALQEDGLGAYFSDLLNANCERTLLPAPSVGAPDRSYCFKRGVRANVGVPAGSFRYFEATRQTALTTPNMGAGIISATGALDPFCCFTSDNSLDPQTPPSITANWASSFWRRLVNVQGANWGAASPTLGIAVDHRTAGTVIVTFVYRTTGGLTTTTSSPITLTGFPGDPIPFIFGHPQDGSPLAASQTVNFGLQPFVYSADLRALLGGSVVPGIGDHQRPLP